MFQKALDWSEVWALVIPLSAFLFRRRKRITGSSLIFIYLIFALLLNMMADANWLWRDLMPEWFQSNNIIYNVHSIVRTSVLGIIFIEQAPFKSRRIINVILLSFYLLFAVIDFICIQSIMIFSSYLFSAEGIVLMLMSLPCLWHIFTEEKINEFRHMPLFWIALGISIYEAANFFIFVFYSTLINSTSYFAQHIWDVHNVFYIFFCLCLARSIYGNK